MEKERKREGRGGEMRRGIVIGGMVIGLLMGCNNGIADELASEKRLGEIGRSAENTFYSFINFIADTLGFRVTAKTTKQEVGEYFSKLGGKVGEASEELEKVAVKATADGDKEGILSKAIKEAVEAAKATLNSLKGHLESLKEIGDSSKVGEAASGGSATQGVASEDGALKKVLKAFKEIVKVAISTGVSEPKAGAAVLNITGVDNKEGTKILSTASSHKPTTTDAGKAAAILSTVSGEEILESIVKSEEVKALGAQADASTTPLEFAKGSGGDNNYLGAAATPKAAAVAGGIALRSLVKSGKLASGAGDSATGGSKDVQAVGIDSVNKLLRAVEDIIRKTVKSVLGTAKEKIDKARDSKATIQK